MKRLLWGCAAVVVCVMGSGGTEAVAQRATACDSPCKLQHLPLVGWKDQPVPNSNPLQELQGNAHPVPGTSPPAMAGRRGDSTANIAHVKLPPFERDVAVPAESMNNVMPSYPMLLRIARMSGNVVASFVVDTLGRVTPASVEIVRASNSQFATAVLQSIPDLRFTPAVGRNGRKVAQLMRESVEFRLLKGGMTQVGVRADGCTLANAADLTDVPACASPPLWSTSVRRPVSWGWTLGGENVTGAYARSRLYTPGVVVGAQLQFPLSSPRLALRVDGMYHWIGVNFYCGAVDRGFCGFSYDHVQVVTLGADLVARLNDRQVRWSPYVVGGVGANLSSTGHSAKYLDSQLGGLQGGVGFEFRLRQATTFVEARYIGLPPGGLAVWNLGFRY
jgi:TonB family protein